MLPDEENIIIVAGGKRFTHGGEIYQAVYPGKGKACTDAYAGGFLTR